jgi:sialic acid synthase SpsE
MFSKFFKKNFSQPYVIAEIGVNHSCSIELAKKQIFLAKKSGASAVKFQTYKAEKIASKYSLAYWDLKEEKIDSQFHLFKKFDHFNEKEYLQLYNYCRKLKIDFSSTPFDLDSVKFLKKMVKFFKIASSDITNLQLIEAVAKTNLPLVISTGASELDEIKKAVKLIKKFNNNKIVIMHCVLSYPTSNKNANLSAIIDLKQNFKSELIGYSDHTKAETNFNILTTAYILGAKVIEKHFTHNKKLKGNDHYHAFDYKDLMKFRKKIEEINEVLGIGKKIVLNCEKKSRLFARRSLIASKNLEKGHVLSKNDIQIKRPGTGIQPEYLDRVIGKKIKFKKKEDQVLFKKDIIW